MASKPPLYGIDINAEAELIKQKKSHLSKSLRDLVMAEYDKRKVCTKPPEKKSFIQNLFGNLGGKREKRPSKEAPPCGCGTNPSSGPCKHP